VRGVDRAAKTEENIVDVTLSVVEYRVIVFAGTLKEFIEHDELGPVTLTPWHVLCNDTHYYLDDDFLEARTSNEAHGIKLRNARWYISGVKYDILPGIYSYAMNEGKFKVSIGEDGFLKVQSRPNGSGS